MLRRDCSREINDLIRLPYEKSDRSFRYYFVKDMLLTSFSPFEKKLITSCGTNPGVATGKVCLHTDKSVARWG